ncbi:hypothetical protein KP509_27G032200 [Ceratopteris richardii]|uniref:C2 domain-containing protein n=1 Tax=Ceratopteris richardii TaxID=49495 RepID=A0A8T2RH98_CERRI|nr:hypothetical protein KP509_27G032200 [Ceratopteris richardii]
MEQRKLEVTLISAQDLKNVSHLGRLRPYAQAWIDPSEKQTSPVLHLQGDEIAIWNHTFLFTVPEMSFQHLSAILTFRILHRSHIPKANASVIGSLSLPLHRILREGPCPLAAYQLPSSSGLIQGVVSLRIIVGERYLKDPSIEGGESLPVMAYPAFPDKVSKHPPRFPCYPHSSRPLKRGIPAMPYLPPPGVELPLLH